MVRKTRSLEKLLYSAKENFFEKGYNSVSIDEIAEFAGVSKATLYRHFDSKEKLFRSVVEVFFFDIRTHIENILIEDTPFEEKLETFIQKMSVILKDLKPQLLKDLKMNEPILFMFFLDERAKTIENQLKKLLQQGVDVGAVKAEYNVNLISEMILNSIEKLSLPEFVESNAMTYDAIFRQVIMIILGGICNHTKD